MVARDRRGCKVKEGHELGKCGAGQTRLPTSQPPPAAPSKLGTSPRVGDGGDGASGWVGWEHATRDMSGGGWGG